MTLIPFACPACHTPLESVPNTKGAKLHCPTDGLVYEQHEGVWRFLAPGRVNYFQKYTKSQTQPKQRGYHYKISCNTLLANFQTQARLLTLLDLGAGDGWLSEQLAKQGHHVAAIDLLEIKTNTSNIITALAEFDILPYLDQQFDAVIFNDAFHFSEGYINTLTEALRVLKPKGELIIMNSPFFNHKEDGFRMTAAQDSESGISPEGFLTSAWLESLGDLLFFEWRFIHPKFSLLSHLCHLIYQPIIGKPCPTYPIIIGQIDTSKQPNIKYADII